MTNFNNATDLVNMEPMGSYTDEMKQFVDTEGLHQYSAQTCEMFERFYDTVQKQMTDVNSSCEASDIKCTTCFQG